MSRKVGIIIAVGALIVALAVVVVGLIFQSDDEEDQEYEVTVTTVPGEVTLTFRDVDDPDRAEQVEHSGTDTYTLDAAEVEIEASRDEFRAATVEHTLNPDEPTEVTIELHGETEEAEEIYREESGYYDEQAEIQRELQEESARLREEYPILEELPEETETFRAYEGISQEEGDFAIHVYLPEDDEEQAREDYQAFLQDHDVDPDDIETVEHIEDEAPLRPTPPDSWETIENAEPADVDDFAPDPEGMTSDELALEFLQIANTHDAGQDPSTATALTRAEPLLNQEVEEPANPFHYPRWWDAAEVEAVSYPWVNEISADEEDEGITRYRARVCWAWIPTDGSEAFLDVPRTWELIVREDEDTGNPVITSFDYQDAYHGDDPEAGRCGRDLNLTTD